MKTYIGIIRSCALYLAPEDTTEALAPIGQEREPAAHCANSPKRLEVCTLANFFRKHPDMGDVSSYRARHEGRILGAHTEFAYINKNGRLAFDPKSIADVGLEAIARVAVVTHDDVIVILKPEDLETYQSTVNSSESPPTSNNPILAPASSQP